MTEQHQRRGYALGGQGLLVTPDQRGLPDGCGGLKGVQVPGALVEPQPHNTGGHGTAGNQHHLTAPLPQGHKLLYQTVDNPVVQTPPIGGQQRTAHLDHPAAGSP